jgi:hypothetical protein
MDQNLKVKLETSISNMENKSSKIYFFVQDTMGNAKASIRHIYKMAMVLKKEGYNPIMLHEKPDYTGIGGWLGVEYAELPHQSIEGTQLMVAPEDFLIIPEIFGFVMEQVKDLPCGKVVLCQAYDHMLETLAPGIGWSQYGFYKCITTCETQRQQIDKIMKGVSIDIIEPTISSCFEKQKYPPKPIIAVHAREQRDGLNLIKQFYLRFPQYRWFTFRDLRGMSEEEFSNSLKDCFVSVWIDPTSGWGSFPLESMRSGVPVIGKTPNLVPDWMNEKNGIWVENQNHIIDVLADFCQNWLEDNILEELYTNMEETSNKYIDENKFETLVVSSFEGYLKTRKQSFVDQLQKISE